MTTSYIYFKISSYSKYTESINIHGINVERSRALVRLTQVRFLVENIPAEQLGEGAYDRWGGTPLGDAMHGTRT